MSYYSLGTLQADNILAAAAHSLLTEGSQSLCRYEAMGRLCQHALKPLRLNMLPQSPDILIHLLITDILLIEKYLPPIKYPLLF